MATKGELTCAWSSPRTAGEVEAGLVEDSDQFFGY